MSFRRIITVDKGIYKRLNTHTLGLKIFRSGRVWTTDIQEVFIPFISTSP